MEIHGSNNTRRSSSRLKRKPFSDLTNAASLLESKSGSKSKSKPKPKPVPESDPSHPEPALSSTRDDDDGDRTDAAVTPTSKEKEVSSSAGENADNNDKLENSKVSPQLVFTRRKGKEKAFDAAPTLSCPPLGLIRRTERIESLEDRVTDLREAFSVPPVKKKKKQQFWTTGKLKKPVLPNDFVEKQKAYFAEVDAFELPEEEVSDGELE